MKHIMLDDILRNRGLREGVVSAMKTGSIFIYPTDTVYGIGCNAENPSSVRRIREIKGTDHPFSVIAPSVEWIEYSLRADSKEYLKKLPGPYTLIFLKKGNMLDEASRGKSLGVRIPKHGFTKLVEEAGVPFVTTSANISGQPVIRSVKDMPERLLGDVDFVIDGGELGGKASTVVDLTGVKPMILRE